MSRLLCIVMLCHAVQPTAHQHHFPNLWATLGDKLAGEEETAVTRFYCDQPARGVCKPKPVEMPELY